MRRNIIIGLAMLFFIQGIGQTYDLSVVIKESLSCVFLVKTYDSEGNNIGIGSGFFIDSLGTGITNYHVLQGAKSATICLHNGKEYSISYIQGVDKQHDIIRFSISTEINKSEKIKYLKLSKEAPKIGESVFTIGNPGGLGFSASNGIISSHREDKELGKVLQTTSPISKGSSGSPLINYKGQVVGIISFFLASGQNLNFAISSSYIYDLNLDSIIFDFPEGEKKIETTDNNLSIFKHHHWGTTQSSVRSSMESAILISDDANFFSTEPELVYLIKFLGRPYELTFTFENGRLSSLAYRSVYRIESNDVIKESPLSDALNVFQVLFGELSSILGENYVCQICKLYESGKSSLSKYNCLISRQLSEQSFRNSAKYEFSKANVNTSYGALDIFVYTVFWYIDDTTYALRVGLNMQNANDLPKSESFCILSIYQKINY